LSPEHPATVGVGFTQFITRADLLGRNESLRIVVKEARTLALVVASVLLSVSVSFPFQSAAAHVGPATGSTFYLSWGGASTLPAPCASWNSGIPYSGLQTMSHAVLPSFKDHMGFSHGFGVWHNGFCTDAAYSYSSISSISSASVTLRMGYATQAWGVDANLYDLGTVSNPASPPILLAMGSGNFAAYTPRTQSCSNSKVFTFSLAPVPGAQLPSGHLIGLDLVIGGYNQGGGLICYGVFNPTWTSISSVSIK
jgi:hypothetical protein